MKITSIFVPAPPGTGSPKPGRWFLFSIVFILALYGTFYVSLAKHEAAHREIMRLHGCKNITTVVKLDLSGFARCEDSRIMSQPERALHSLNEIVGYNIDALILAIFLGVFLLSIIIYTSTIS